MKKTSDSISNITAKFVQQARQTEGLKIKKILLYGSYARNEANEESDVDLMILCDNPETELDKRRYEINRIGSRLSLENDIDVEVKIKDWNTFEEWKDVVPFYQNVEREGIVLYG